MARRRACCRERCAHLEDPAAHVSSLPTYPPCLDSPGISTPRASPSRRVRQWPVDRPLASSGATRPASGLAYWGFGIATVTAREVCKGARRRMGSGWSRCLLRSSLGISVWTGTEGQAGCGADLSLARPASPPERLLRRAERLGWGKAVALCSATSGQSVRQVADPPARLGPDSNRPCRIPRHAADRDQPDDQPPRGPQLSRFVIDEQETAE